MARTKRKDLVTVTCYGLSEIMDREYAIAFYLDAMRYSEGAERDRYVNIYLQLLDGAKEATDEM